MTDPDNFDSHANKHQAAKREFIVSEGLQQFRDYYEDDAVESASFEYLDNLSNRDRIRFMEIFEDFSRDPYKGKTHAMISKREYNPELSTFNNLLLDLTDFKDRVRPLANDLALMDVSNKYQTRSKEAALGKEVPFMTQERFDAMSDDEKAAHNAYMDMIVPEEVRADFERTQADRFEAWKQD